MEDPTRWMLNDVPERSNFYDSAEFYEASVDDMHRADEMARAEHEENED